MKYIILPTHKVIVARPVKEILDEQIAKKLVRMIDKQPR
jgi:hypothetical protein